MAYPCIPPSDGSRIQSKHQVDDPKWDDKHSHLKRMRAMSRKEIERQLSEPPEPEYERRA